METCEVVTFINQFPGVKAEQVNKTMIKITAVNFKGYVVYETEKGILNADAVEDTGFDVDEELRDLAERSNNKSIPVMPILKCFFVKEFIGAVMLNIDNSKVLQLPF